MEGKEGVLEARTGHHWVTRRVRELPSWISSPPYSHIQHRADSRHQLLVECPQSWDESFQTLSGLLGKEPPPDLWIPTSGLQVFPFTGQVVTSLKIL